MPAFLTLRNVAFYFRDETIQTVETRWRDWIDRRAIVAVKKDQSQDSPGVTFELLRNRLLINPSVTPEVCIAEPVIIQWHVGNQPEFQPMAPWPVPVFVGAYLTQGDPDVIWGIPRVLTAEDFE